MQIKQMGQVFTPEHIVSDILKISGYTPNNILKKHVIDNSCGDGAFLIRFVQLYLKNYKKEHQNLTGVEKELEKYIHGIEIDKDIYELCLSNLEKIRTKYKLAPIKWDIINGDALQIEKYNNKMDFVIGNPPYVRIHNLKEQSNHAKKYNFYSGGMPDLFLVFFEIGLNMLKENGIMCYITPNSFYTSVAGTELRKYIAQERNLEVIADLGHYQPFSVTTYTTITKFYKSKKFEKCKYYKYDIQNEKPKFIANIPYDELFMDEKIILSQKNNNLKEILNYTPNKINVIVKNGFATLNDNIFIQEKFPFKNHVIRVIKASTGEWKQCIYPYDENGQLIPFKNLDNSIQKYFLEKKELLLKRNLEKKADWYAFGRSQAINDVYQNKISINTTIKDISSIKLNQVKSGEGIYSGLYMLTNIPFSKIKEKICTTEFIEYLKLVNKCKSGGYYTLSSRDLSKYINYVMEDPMTNQEFLEVIKESFNKYLETHSRSNEKLKILHGKIAKDLQKRLGQSYIIHSLGLRDGKEINMPGKYMPKKVDIAIEKNKEIVGAIALKFIMSNYSQNSNNYFENMLGETSNIRANGKPYFQILILPTVVP